MNSELEKYERIQEYLRGRMSEKDRAAFEKDLSSDDSLRDHYDDLSLLARSIRKANQEVDLRIALEEYEKQRTESFMAVQEDTTIDTELNQIERELRNMGIPVEEPKPRIFKVLKDRMKGALSFIVQWFTPTDKLSAEPTSGNTITFSLSYASRMAISFAVAASLALAIILPYNANLATSVFNYAPSRLELQTFRGNSFDIIEDAIISYNNEDYDAALFYFEEARNSLKTTLSKLSNSDSDVITKQRLYNELYKVEWYSALALMKDKKVKVAKRTLRSISRSDSPFANEALDILKNVY